jgi:hypothetical protein
MPGDYKAHLYALCRGCAKTYGKLNSMLSASAVTLTLPGGQVIRGTLSGGEEQVISKHAACNVTFAQPFVRF